MNTDQTAPTGAVCSGFTVCLQCKLSMKTGHMSKDITLEMNGWKRGFTHC